MKRFIYCIAIVLFVHNFFGRSRSFFYKRSSLARAIQKRYCRTGAYAGS